MNSNIESIGNRTEKCHFYPDSLCVDHGHENLSTVFRFGGEATMGNSDWRKKYVHKFNKFT